MWCVYIHTCLTSLENATDGFISIAKVCCAHVCMRVELHVYVCECIYIFFVCGIVFASISSYSLCESIYCLCVFNCVCKYFFSITFYWWYYRVPVVRAHTHALSLVQYHTILHTQITHTQAIHLAPPCARSPYTSLPLP